VGCKPAQMEQQENTNEKVLFFDLCEKRKLGAV